MSKKPKTSTPTVSYLADLEVRVRHANSRFASAVMNEDRARKELEASRRALDDAQRALDARMSELHNSAHRDSYWKR